MRVVAGTDSPAVSQNHAIDQEAIRAALASFVDGESSLPKSRMADTRIAALKITGMPVGDPASPSIGVQHTESTDEGLSSPRMGRKLALSSSLAQFRASWRAVTFGRNRLNASMGRQPRGTWVAVSIAIWAFAPPAIAQRGSNLPVVRIEARQVLVPTFVIARYNDSNYDVLHLDASDFHVFEDNKEQKIEKVTLQRTYRRVVQDNIGVQDAAAVTPNAKWVRLSDGLVGTPVGGYYYVIAYAPPLSPEGSCHEIKVKVDPKDASGHRLTRAEMSPVLGRDGLHTYTVDVDRRNLLVDSRTEYCNIAHLSTDPLYGTNLAKQMEGYAAGAKAKKGRLSLRAINFYDEPGSARMYIAIDFASMGSQTGIPGFVIALLGIVSKSNGEVATRFSDSIEVGCPFEEDSHPDPRTTLSKVCRQTISNHYETEVPLPAGDYDLRVVMSYDGELHRVDAPVSVGNFDGQHIAVSGIALCKRFYQHWEPARSLPSSNAQTKSQSDPLNSVPTMPFQLVPLVSKGMELTPTGDTNFKKKEPLIAYFEVYEPPLKAGGVVTVQFEMRITNIATGQLETDTGLRSTSSFVQPGMSIIPIAEQIAINELPKGEYRLEVQASDSAGKSTVWRVVNFAVE